MKTFSRWTLRIIFSSVLSLWLSLTIIPSAKVKAVSPSQIPQNQTTNTNPIGSPISLIIPSINVSARIQYVGMTAEREMETPNNSSDVGWFDLGVLPGEKGSAVVDGHFDTQSGDAGVFFNLYKLRPGDKIYVTDSNEQTLVFIVRGSRLFNPGLADEVLNGSDSAHLNLITCDGVWDGTKKSYSKRLVVFTDRVN